MKIDQVPMGGHFIYGGREFVKTGPMTATALDGSQRMIPRYAVLGLVGEEVAAPESGAHASSRNAAVLQAFDEFYQTCRKLAGDASARELQAARDRFLEKLDLEGDA